MDNSKKTLFDWVLEVNKQIQAEAEEEFRRQAEQKTINLIIVAVCIMITLIGVILAAVCCCRTRSQRSQRVVRPSTDYVIHLESNPEAFATSTPKPKILEEIEPKLPEHKVGNAPNENATNAQNQVSVSIDKSYSLVLQKLGHLPKETPDILLEKHILPDNVSPSQAAATRLSNERDSDIDTNTVFEHVDQIWKCRILERSPDNFLYGHEEVNVSAKPLQAYQCQKVFGLWDVMNLGKRYAVFGKRGEHFHYLDETLVVSPENIEIREN